MRGWLLDTNVIASLSAADGAATVKAWAASQDESQFYLSILTLAEYDKGVHQLADDDPSRLRYAAAAAAIASRFADRVIPLSDTIVRRWGTLAGRIRRDTGHPPPVINTLIAATAMETQLYLATRNKKDVRHTGVIAFDPWRDDPADFSVTAG